MKTYPVSLVLHERLVVLIGARGEIAHKVEPLLEAGARVRVIAPSADDHVVAAAAQGRIEWLRRAYAPGDLTGAALVMAATGSAQVHAQIHAEACANGQLLNVVDVPRLCNFYSVSVVRRGLLTIAIGTGGAAPALSVTLRKRFEREFGPEYACFLEFAQALRPTVAKRIPSFRKRQQFWYALVESDALALLRADAQADICALAVRLLDQFDPPPTIPANGERHEHAPTLEIA